MLWGDGTPTREFLFVDDCVEGFVLAAERYDGAEPVNLGTGVETSIRELAETIAEVTGFEGEIVWDTSMPNGQPRRQLDASRAEELFGFRADVPLREGIERTVAWYREARTDACSALSAAVPQASDSSRARLDRLLRRPRAVLAGLVVVQWLAMLAFALTVEAQRLAATTRAAISSGTRPRGGSLGDGDLPPTGVGLLVVDAVRPDHARDAVPTSSARSRRSCCSTCSCSARSPSAASTCIAARIGGELLGLWTAALWVRCRSLPSRSSARTITCKYVELLLPRRSD